MSSGSTIVLLSSTIIPPGSIIVPLADSTIVLPGSTIELNYVENQFGHTLYLDRTSFLFCLMITVPINNQTYLILLQYFYNFDQNINQILYLTRLEH